MGDDEDAHRTNYRQRARLPWHGRSNLTEKGNKPLPGRIFQTFEMCFTTLCALLWSAHDELVYVQDCFARLLHSAWFGKYKFLMYPSSAPYARTVRERKKWSVCYISGGVLLRAKSICPEPDNHIMTAHTENPSSGATSRGGI